MLAKQIFDLLINREQISGDYKSTIDSNDFDKKLDSVLGRLADDNILDKIKALSENIVTEQQVKMDVDFRNVNELSNHGAIVSADENFNNFAEFLKFAKSLKHAPTMPKEIGSKVNNNLIHRITIDNRIFRQRTNNHLKRGEPEIIVLIDLSGSMVSVNLLYPVLQVSKSVFASLYNVGLPIAVYGHTTGYASSVVYGIAANNMPLMNKALVTTRDYEQCFNRVLGVSSASNADGIAIQFVASRFSDRQGDKAVIILSDGRPSAYGYDGETAIEHTKNVVENLRNSNISVLSLSLTKEVMENNDRIYGNGNIQAWGNMLESNFRKAISSIIKRG
jgi:hypothetical protein